MAYDNTRLQELQQRIARGEHLQNTLRDLNKQKLELEIQRRELEALMLDEQEDVDRLERRSLASFYYNVIGRLDEKLDQERAEAYAARVKFDNVAQCLSSLVLDINAVRDELSQLDNCKAEYEQALREKQAEIRASGTPEADRILDLEAQIAKLEARQKELREAVSAGRQAERTVGQIIDSLDSADGLATWDMLGGGLIADIAKHDRLNEAQSLVNSLQYQLRRFRAELADVSVSADIQVSMGSFMSVADFFFDGLFADWAVKDHISRALNQAWDAQRRIQTVLSRLEPALNTARSQCEKTKTELEELVLQAGRHV